MCPASEISYIIRSLFLMYSFVGLHCKFTLRGKRGAHIESRNVDGDLII